MKHSRLTSKNSAINMAINEKHRSITRWAQKVIYCYYSAYGDTYHGQGGTSFPHRILAYVHSLANSAMAEFMQDDLDIDGMQDARLMLQLMLTSDGNALSSFGMKKMEDLLHFIAEERAAFFDEWNGIGHGGPLGNRPNIDLLTERVVDCYLAVRVNAHPKLNFMFLPELLASSVRDMYMANPVDRKGELRAASALCALLTPTGNDISPYGLKFMERWLGTLEKVLSDKMEADESESAEEGDDQGRQQIIKRWAQRVADAYRAAHGDFYRIGEVMIHINNEKFPAAIEDFIRHPSQENDEDHKAKVPTLPRLEDMLVAGTLRSMLRKDGSLNANGNEIIYAMFSWVVIEDCMDPEEAVGGHPKTLTKEWRVGKI